MSTPLHRANSHIVQRYLTKLHSIEPNTDPEDPTGIQHLMAMCEKIVNTPDMLDDKQCRWLGYIQGIMAVRGHLDIEDERVHTRPVFHRAYEEMGIEIPESVEVHGE